MSQTDKNKLTVLGIVILLILFIITVHYGMSFVPWYIIAVIAAVGEGFIYMPKISSSYHRLNNLDAPKSRFIPIWSEIQIMDPVYAKMCLGSIAISVLCLIGTQLPLEIISSFFSMRTTMAWGYNSLVVFICVLIVTNFIFGFGLCKILRAVNCMLLDCIGEPVWKLECVFYIVMLLPFIRVCALSMLNNKIDTLLNFGYGKEEIKKFIEE